MKNLTRLKKLDENAPDTMEDFRGFWFKAGAIDVLHKQWRHSRVAPVQRVMRGTAESPPAVPLARPSMIKVKS